MKTSTHPDVHGYTRKGSGYRYTYTSWNCMRQRCYYRTVNPRNRSYLNKGIKICARWGSFANFVEDMGKRPFGMTLDRIDRDRDYAPENCRWADQKTQHREITMYDGKLCITCGKSRPHAHHRCNPCLKWFLRHGVDKTGVIERPLPARKKEGAKL